MQKFIKATHTNIHFACNKNVWGHNDKMQPWNALLSGKCEFLLTTVSGMSIGTDTVSCKLLCTRLCVFVCPYMNLT